MEIKLKLKGSSDYDGIFTYKLNKVENMHRVIANFLDELGFDEDAILKIDQNIEELNDDYIGAKSGDKRIDIFVSRDDVFLVVESHTAKIVNIAKKYFSF